MTSATLAMDQPPWGMTTPAAAQMIITTVLAVVTAGFVVAALASWYHTKHHPIPPAPNTTDRSSRADVDRSAVGA
jgi:hypothetical protein